MSISAAFVPIPSGDLAVFVGSEREPSTVVGWLVATEICDDGSVALHTIRPVYLDGGDAVDVLPSTTYTVVRQDDLDRI